MQPKPIAGSLLGSAVVALAALGAMTPDRPRPVPAAAGTIEGVVRLAGDQTPVPRTVANTTDPAVCGEIQSRGDLLVAEPSRGIRNVIVALGGPAAEDLPAAPPGRLVLDNHECQFAPHVAVLTAGSTIEATSQDHILHTVHFYGALVRNVALPMAGMRVTVIAAKPGMITVLCDVHGWMLAFVRVDHHRYHAVSDAEGSFRLDDVPAGSYELEIWHERLGRRSQPVNVHAGATSELEIVYSLDDR
jgi:plastocyanin